MRYFAHFEEENNSWVGVCHKPRIYVIADSRIEAEDEMIDMITVYHSKGDIIQLIGVPRCEHCDSTYVIAKHTDGYNPDRIVEYECMKCSKRQPNRVVSLDNFV